jgi:hypothetical protein
VRAQAYIGARYDYCGLLFSQLVKLRGHDRDKWFCSEFCAHAMGLTHPQTYSPVGLWRWVLAHQELGEIHEQN